MSDLRPMLCKEAPRSGGEPVFPPDPTNWVMERKLDGWRFMLHKTEHGCKWIGGRNGQEYCSRALDDIVAMAHLIPDDTVIDGELVPLSNDGVPQKSPQVSTILAHPDRGSLWFVMFDLLALGGMPAIELGWSDRRVLLDKLDRKRRMFSSITGRAHVSDPRPLDIGVYEYWLDQGAEGAVIKRKTGRYAPGKRSDDWLKMKPQQTCDATIVGVELGKGEHNAGLPGAFEIRLETGVLTTVKVPDDATVSSVHKNPGLWVGKMIEIRHSGIMESGKPRHPVMVRTRLDREAT